jgi:hypothetical protein
MSKYTGTETSSRSSNELSDEGVGARLCEAVQRRVAMSVEHDLAPNHNLVVVTPAKSRRHRAAIIGLLSIFTIGGLGGRGALQIANHQNEKKKVVTKSTQQTDIPRLVMKSPGLRLSSYWPSSQSVHEFPNVTRFHVRNGNEWFNLQLGTSFASNGPPSKEFKIRNVDGVVRIEPSSWNVSWRIGELPISANGMFGNFPAPNVGAGPEISTHIQEAISAVSISNGILASTELPHGFKAIKMEGEFEGYSLSYVNAKLRSPPRRWTNTAPSITTDSDLIQLHVSRGEPWVFEDYYTHAKVIHRDGRTYYLSEGPNENAAGTIQLSGISWAVKKHVIADISSDPGRYSAEELLSLADSVGSPSAEQWRDVEQMTQLIDSLSAEKRWEVLAEGAIDSTEYALVANKRESGATCQTVELRWDESKVGACIEDSTLGLFRLLKVSVVNGSPIVFGVTEQTSPENHVVRIVDSAGSIVGEDVTTDETFVNGRSYAIELPNNAVGPFTVEFYDFDRTWYIDTYDSEDHDSFVRPDAKPIATSIAKLEG